MAYSLKASYKTCELIGLTQLRKFDKTVTQPFEMCMRTCQSLLLKNKWIQVFNHGYLNETSITDGFEWQNTKIYVIFYNGESEVPIGYGNNAMVQCNNVSCETKCSISDRYTTIGFQNDIKVYFKRDKVNGNVVFLHHSAANITLYIRSAKAGFSFGIHLPEEMIADSEGICTTGCPVKTSLPSTCVDREIGRKVCEASFDGLKVDEFRFEACIQDIYLWRNVNFSVDHRLSALDFELMSDFNNIHNKISIVSVKNVESFQTMIKPDTQNCYANMYNKSNPSVSKCY